MAPNCVARVLRAGSVGGLVSGRFRRGRRPALQVPILAVVFSALVMTVDSCFGCCFLHHSNQSAAILSLFYTSVPTLRVRTQAEMA